VVLGSWARRVALAEQASKLLASVRLDQVGQADQVGSAP
jgi:hypothetical protein